MADSKIVQVAEGLAAAIETERAAGNFELTNFEVEWDFEGRVKDQQLTDTDLHVRVIIPRRYDSIDRFSRTDLQYTASYDIDVRERLGIANQGAENDIDKLRLKKLSRLVEQIHEFFHSNPRPIASIDAEWIDERKGLPKSQILIAYSVKYLREQRQFYGVCREVFQVTL